MILGTDLNFASHCAPEPQPGVIGRYLGPAPVEGKLHIKFKGADLGFLDRQPLELYIRSELVGEIGDEFLAEPIPREPSKRDSYLDIDIFEIDGLISEELKAIWLNR